MKYIVILAVLGAIGGGYFIIQSFNNGASKQVSNTVAGGFVSLLDGRSTETEERMPVKDTEEGISDVLIDNGETTEYKDTVLGTAQDATSKTNNAEIMKLTDHKDIKKDMTTSTMLVAGGCFWCVESDLEKVPGVIEVVSGYAEGTNEYPTYQNYIQNGHREVVEVTYNPAVVSFEEILIATIKHTDPTDDDGSFADRGNYYSTALYYENDTQKEIINNLIKEIDTYGPYDAPLAIDVLERPKFWPAEEYHQDYYKKGLSKLKYKYYRKASGRDNFIQKYWPDDTSPVLPWRKTISSAGVWNSFQKPSNKELQQRLTDIQYKVTQKNGTERAFQNAYWDNKAEGIYVDIVSGEPLFSSTNKFDSGTGWPSFTRPIEYTMVTEKDDYVLLQKRIEVRSKIANSHLGHIFNDAPEELGGVRYCINSAALRFVPKEHMKEEGYGEFLKLFK